MKFYQLISLILVFFLLSTIVYVFYYVPSLSLQKASGNYQVNDSISEKKSVCTDGQDTTCKTGSCDGIKTCKSGQWTECFLVKVCLPGTNTSCNENGCAVGYKTCNDCGTGYGECTE